MFFPDLTSLFSTLDGIALVVLILTSQIVGHFIENPPKKRPSLSQLMVFYRREWMIHFVDRNPRVFDAQILGNLRQSTAFFASASMIALGGGLAMIGNPEQLVGVTQEFDMLKASPLVLEVKLVAVLILIANAFLKFVWAHRLFGYCAIVMAAVPNDPDDSTALARANKAAEISISAARSFNRGMRSVYFGLTVAAWIFGAAALLLATAITGFVLLRREFASHSRAALLRDPR